MTALTWGGIALTCIGLVSLVWAYSRVYSRLRGDITERLVEVEPNLFSDAYSSALDAEDKTAVNSLLVELAITKLRARSSKTCRLGILQLAQLGGQRAFDALLEEMRLNASWLLRAEMADAAQAVAAKLQVEEHDDSW